MVGVRLVREVVGSGIRLASLGACPTYVVSDSPAEGAVPPRSDSSDEGGRALMMLTRAAVAARASCRERAVDDKTAMSEEAEPRGR